MEPILDYSNEKAVPIVKWSDALSRMSSNERVDVCESRESDPDNRNRINNEKNVMLNGGKNGNSWSSDKDLKIDLDDNISSSSSCSSSKKHEVPDGGWGWVVVFASFIISMIADGVSFSFGLLYIEFLNHFQESKSKTSWIGSLFMSVPLLLGPVMSALVDRYGCRKMTILGGLISGTGFVLASFGDSFVWELVFFGLFAGVGLGLCYVTAVVSIAYWFDKYRTLAVGLGACGMGVGTFVYAPLTQFLIEEFGWRGTVLLLAGTFFNMCVCGAVMRDPEWLTREQNKNKLRCFKDGSSCYSINAGNGFPCIDDLNVLMKKRKSPEYVLTALVTTIENSKKSNVNDRLPSVRSVVNLPTYMRQNEKVPLEVLEQLSNNKTLFNVILENYPSLLHSKSLSYEEKLNQLSSETKHIPVTMSMKLRRLKNGDNCFTDPAESCISDFAAKKGLLKKKKMSFAHASKSFSGKKPLTCTDSAQHHYFRDIRLHRNSVVYRGAMMNIPRYRLRASSCPDIFRNSTTTLAKENEEKWCADALGLLRAMFDFSMFVDLHFLLMSLATILLFTWFIVPYFYLAEHLTRHGYSEVEGSVLLSIIGVANCVGMIALGWAGDQPWMNVNKTYAACLVLCGLSSILMPLLIHNYNLLALISALFGLFFASNYSFTPSILVQLIPLEKFTTAYGLILLCQGIGNLVGPPLAGWIFDVTGEWDLSFYMAGAWIVVAGVLTICIQFTTTRTLWSSSEKEK